ncbi:MAG TPA: transglycosylase domain-containing protein [Actinomycetota bacterium]
MPVLVALVVVVASGFFALLLSPLAATVSYGVSKVDERMDFLGDCKKLAAFPQRSTVYASDGTTELATLYLDFNREVVRLADVSEVTRKAVLAIEDDRFYEHGALDFPSLVRAAIANLLRHEVVQGGSTITQQLVKLAVLEDTSQTAERKFKEAAIANCLERKYTKDEILELYLNEVYLGNGVYGVGTASDFYFHVPASKLNLSQGALLAGMLQAPGTFDPVSHPKAATRRRNEVIARMAELGWITPLKASKAEAAGLGLADDVGTERLAKPPFIVRYIVGQILANADGEFDVFGRTERQRTRTLYQGGLSITTTLDADWQEAAQAAANQPWYIHPSNPHYRQSPDVAIVTVDNANGAIRTMLSGRNYAKDQIRLATAPRQPGSAFKPFTLVAAFEQDVPPGSVFSSKSPFHTPLWNNDCHCVSNAEGAGDSGYLNLWQATAESVNVVFAQLELSLQGQGTAVAEAAEKMGIGEHLVGVPSITLGTEEVSPLEMAAAYQTLANDGVHCASYAVARVVTSTGKTLYKHRPDCEQVIKPDIAHLVSAMLRGVVSSGGTGWRAALPGRPVAGKTGTTQDYSNAWFTGYTEQVSTAVWVGFPYSTDSMEPYFGQSVFGGTVAAPIWHSYMVRVMNGLPVKSFPPPPAPQSGRIPDVVGSQSEHAQKELAAAHFTPREKLVPSLEPKGTVVSQTPAAGTSAVLGSLVTIDVSNGKAPKVTVPDLVGHVVGFAKAKLANLGLGVTVVEKVVTDPNNEDIVLEQSPKAGEKVDEGTKVTLTVGVLDGGGTGGDGDVAFGGGSVVLFGAGAAVLRRRAARRR